MLTFCLDLLPDDLPEPALLLCWSPSIDAANEGASGEAMSSPRYADRCDECALDIDIALAQLCTQQIAKAESGACREDVVWPPLGT